MAAGKVGLLCNRAIGLAEHGGFDQARVVLKQAAVAAGTDKKLRGLIHISYCRLNRLLGDLDEARAHGERALDLLQKSGGLEETVEALVYLSSAERKRGKFILAESLGKRAVRLLGETQNQRLTVLAHWGLGSALENLERFSDAYVHLRTAAAAAEGVLGLRDQAALRCDLAFACRERGELDEALRLSEEALRMMELVGDVRMIADIHNDTGAIHARRCDRGSARQSYVTALAILGEDITPEAAESHYELARLELEEARPPKALEQAQLALKMANHLRSDVEEGQSCLVMAQALMSLSRPGEAVPYLRRARDVFAEYGLEQSNVVATELLHHAEGGLDA